jgi:hypothetical protein
MRDGRLSGPELAAFGRHTTTCRSCAEETKALDQLVERLEADAPAEVPVDELRVARERTRLLADFDRSLLASGRGGNGRWLLLSAAAMAAACALFFLSRARPVAPIANETRADVRPQEEASWSRRVDGDVETIVLERGALSIHVGHAAPRRSRLVVVLPDGELEDIGTTFTVSAADGHTRRVEVREGSVLLRVHGRPPVALSAGQTWTADAGPTKQPERVATPPLDVAKPAKAEPNQTADRHALPRPQAPLATDESVQSTEFRAIVHLLERGDECDAAAGFAKYVRTYPDDPRAEDASYLRVIALQRCGSEDAMKRAAGEYLARYPSGFRRAEVERLSR